MPDTVAVEGRITVNNSDEMRQKLVTALRSKPAKVIVDLSRVTYMDSSGLATLLEATRTARRQGTQLLLAGLSGQPKSVFNVAHLEGLFEFVPRETIA